MYPKSLEMQNGHGGTAATEGIWSASPAWSLAVLSDWGERGRPTTLQLQG
jgi:hypothetical protein